MSTPKSLRWRIAQWLEIRWWQRYLRTKNKSEYYLQKARYWHKTLEALSLQLPPKQQILEVGCGPAGIFIILQGHQVRAIDPLLDQYTANLPHFTPSDFPWVSFESCPLETISESASPWVFCFNAINHIANWERGLDQLTAHTTQDGTLILGSDVHKYQPLKIIFRWLPGDLLHPQQHDSEDYRRALKNRGWIIKNEVILKKGFIFDYWIAQAQKDTAS